VDKGSLPSFPFDFAQDRPAPVREAKAQVAGLVHDCVPTQIDRVEVKQLEERQ
jgi:hypothetical protein